MGEYSYIGENYRALSEKIKTLSALAGRKVTLVAVTKSGNDAELVALAEAGMLEIAENRPGELRRRADILYAAGYKPTLHEIGNLQRNKVKLIAPDVALIHSLDTIELAREIDKHATRLGRVIPALIEVNSAREEQKGGVDPDFAEEFLLALRNMNGIEVRGLMTMGPVSDDPETLRPYFRETKQLFDRLNAKYEFRDGGILSMGMSDSYEVAIEEGSTLVRVGRAFFRK
ncbi:MAG: YggS family pyridoxal phosphate-dependent enzyme [Clostridia bacterium]|nr:YggS family pyridoxal phosphate-dependent enzyme [Clostridia bacterium]